MTPPSRRELLDNMHWWQSRRRAWPLAFEVLWQAPSAVWDQRRAALAFTPARHVVLVRGGNRSGKGQVLSALLRTPSGWAQVGGIGVGDTIMAGDGSWTSVTGVFPQGPKQTYKLTFSDGASATVDADHLWRCKDRARRFRKDGPHYGQWTTLDTQTILDRWGASPRPVQRIAIPVVGRADAPPSSLPVDPWLLGAWLGDGSGASICKNDDHTHRRVLAALPPDCTGMVESYPHRASVVRISGLLPYLRALGIDGKRSWEKSIPPSYMLASAPQRMELLHGLMDTDGTCGKQGSCSFSSTSERLARDVMELAHSLGCKATINDRITQYAYKGECKDGRRSWRVQISAPGGLSLFSLPRKAERQRSSLCEDRVLVSIEDTGVQETQCISVAHPSETYVTGKDYVVTHNTKLIKDLIVAMTLGGDHPMVRVWLKQNDLPPDYIPPGPGRTVMVAQSAADSIRYHRDDVDRLLPAEGKQWYAKNAQYECRVLIDCPGYARQAEIYFKSIDQGARRFKGMQARFIAIDEEPEGQEGKLVFEECLRATSDTGGWVGMAMTPQSGFTWVYDEIEVERKHNSVVATLDSLDNAYTPNRASLVSWLDGMDPDEQRMRRKGDFVSRAGLVYGDYEPGDGDRWGPGHLCTPFEIPEEWPKFRAADFGLVLPTVVLWGALGDDNTLYIYREHYLAGTPYEVQAPIVLEAEGCTLDPAGRPLSMGEAIECSWGDPGDTGAEAMRTWAQYDLYFRNATKDVLEGIDATRARLRRWGPPPGRPRIKIFTNCTYTLREIQGYRWSSKTIKPTPVKRDDHCMDALRYLVVGVDEWVR